MRQLFEEKRFVIGIDPGRNLGYSVLKVVGEGKRSTVVLYESGILDLHLGNYRGGGIALVQLESFLKTKIKKLKCLGKVFLAYELNRFLVDQNGRPQGPDSTILYGQLIGIVELVCEKLEIPFDGIPPRSIKKLVMGNGNCKKEEVRDFLSRRFKKKFKSKLDESDSIACSLAFVKRLQWGA